MTNVVKTRIPALTHRIIPQNICAATVETSHTVPNVPDMKDTLKLVSFHERLMNQINQIQLATGVVTNVWITMHNYTYPL
jgi:hypothetical protein